MSSARQSEESVAIDLRHSTSSERQCCACCPLTHASSTTKATQTAPSATPRALAAQSDVRDSVLAGAALGALSALDLSHNRLREHGGKAIVGNLGGDPGQF